MTRRRPFVGRPVERDAQRDDDFWEIFAAKLEPVTPEVRAQLVGRGWNAAQLDQLVQEGWQYNRQRDSLMMPLEYEGRW